MAEESAGEADVARLAGSGDDVAGTDTESSSADEREGVDLIEKELTSALPWKQVIPLCLLQVSETFNSSGIFAYSAFLVSDFTGVSVDQAGFAAGFLQAASYFGMFLSSFGWGVASDRLGKRPCLLLGTTGSLLSCLAFGFSVNLPMAVAVRFANGCLNGNLGIAKSYLGAITHEKNQARAFSLIAICWGAGALVGAAIGGFLARPAVQYPTVFDAKGLFGTFPYLLPNLVTAVFNLAGLIGGFLFLAEPKVERNVAADGSSYPPVWRQRKAMLATLAYVFLGFVFVLYEEAMPLFLAATNGGMGMMTAQIGLFQSILGGVFLVTTFFYRYIPERIGLLKTHRLGLLMSVPLMVVTPLTAWVVKQPTAVVWTVMVVLCVAWGITDNLSFAPIMVLIANGTRKSQLGALNGVAQSGVALMRATGPVLAGTLFAWSIEPSRNFPYFVFLIMAALTLCLFGYALLLPPELDKPFVEPPEQRELHNMSA